MPATVQINVSCNAIMLKDHTVRVVHDPNANTDTAFLDYILGTFANGLFTPLPGSPAPGGSVSLVPNQADTFAAIKASLVTAAMTQAGLSTTTGDTFVL